MKMNPDFYRSPLHDTANNVSQPSQQPSGKSPYHYDEKFFETNDNSSSSSSSSSSSDDDDDDAPLLGNPTKRNTRLRKIRQKVYERDPLISPEYELESRNRAILLSIALCFILLAFWLLDSLKDPVFATLVHGDLDKHQPIAKMISVLSTLVLVVAVEYVHMRRKQREEMERDLMAGSTWRRAGVGSSSSDGGEVDLFVMASVSIGLMMGIMKIFLILGVSCLHEISLTCLDYVMKLIGLSRFQQKATTSTFERRSHRGKEFRFTVPNLWMLFIVMATLKAMTYSVNDPAKEILYMPTSTEVKFKMKFWIDVVGQRLAKAMGSAVTNYAGSADRLVEVGTVPSVVTSVLLLMMSQWAGWELDGLVEGGEVVCLAGEVDM